MKTKGRVETKTENIKRLVKFHSRQAAKFRQNLKQALVSNALKAHDFGTG